MNYNNDPQANLSKAQYIKNRIAVRHNNQANNIVQAEYDKHTNNINWREEPTPVINKLVQNLPIKGDDEATEQVVSNEGGNDNFQIG